MIDLFPDYDRMAGTMAAITLDYPRRYTGSDEERLCAGYIAERLGELGLEVELTQIPAVGWEVRKGPSISILSPVREDVEAAPLLFSGSTPLGGMEVEVKPAGKGFRVGRYPTIYSDLIGVEDQRKKGFMLIRTDGPPMLYNPPGFLAYPWPSFIVGHEIGARITDWLRCGRTVRLRYEIETGLCPGEQTFLVRGALAGKVDPDKIVIVGAHHDSQGARGLSGKFASPGAIDNASGVALVIELARYFKSAGYPYSIWFCTFGGEERHCSSSFSLVERLERTSQIKNVIAYINIDQAAKGTPLTIYASSVNSPVQPKIDFLNFAQDIVTSPAVAKKYPVKIYSPPLPCSDHWPFYQAGVPVIYPCWDIFDGYHTSEDDLEHCDQPEQYSLIAEIVYKAFMYIAEQDLDRGRGV